MEVMLIFKKVVEQLKQKKSFYFCLFLYHCLFLVLFLANFTPGKWFLGWDSVTPEFNFSLNFQRGVFSSWQENYGVGLLGGHGFAATLPHTILTWFLSLMVPQESIRLIFTFLTWYIGGLGAFFLAHVVFEHFLRQCKFSVKKVPFSVVPFASLLTASYYLMNLATVFIFSIQLDAFIIHFAALPWLFWSILQLLSVDVNKKKILFFVVISFFGSGQAFIPSLFVAFLVALTILLVFYCLFSLAKKQAFKKSFLIVFITFLVNAYWLLPFSYYVFSRSAHFSDAYNNLISTPEMEQKSEKYGTLENVSLLKGFYWESYEVGGYIEQVWRAHHQQKVVPLIGYGIFSLAVLGVIAAWFLSKDWRARSLSIVSIYFIGSLAFSVPPFSTLLNLLHTFLPTLAQAFRTSFTKLGLGAALFVSVFFGLSSMSLFLLLARISKKAQRRVFLGFFLMLFLAVFYYAWPLFQGNLISKKMLLSLPQPYQEVMQYFKTQPDGRIADFPQNCAEGWYAYNWGYFGSGFYWYGVRQPFMSRTFDVWSNANENYYWQVNQALMNQDYERVDAILGQYDIKWLIFDQNVVQCRDKNSLFGNQDFLKYLDSHEDYTLVKEFSDPQLLPIYLYERKTTSRSFVQVMPDDLPNVGPEYVWTDFDQAVEIPHYITDVDQAFDRYYPFRSLFTKRATTADFQFDEDPNNLILTTKLPTELSGYTISIPSYREIEASIPVVLRISQLEDGRGELELFSLLPQVWLAGEQLNSVNKQMVLGTFTFPDDQVVKVYVSGIESSGNDSWYYGSFVANRPNSVYVRDNQGRVLFEWQESETLVTFADLLQEQKYVVASANENELKIIIPKSYAGQRQVQIFENSSRSLPVPCDEVEASYNNKFEITNDISENSFIRLLSQDSKQCLSLAMDNISTGEAYLLKIHSRNLGGQKLRLEVDSNNSFAGIDTYLTYSNDLWQDQYLVLPPTFLDGRNYTLRFKNTSNSYISTINDLGTISAWSFPYAFTKAISVQNDQTTISPAASDDWVGEVEVSHPNPTFYTVHLSQSDSTSRKLLLYQSYAPEWLALSKQTAFPYLKTLPHHEKLNSWSNAWQLTGTEERVYLFFWPQLLEYLGFIFLIIGVPAMFFFTAKRHGSFQKAER